MPYVFGTLLDWNTTHRLIDNAETSVTNWAPLFALLALMYLASGITWLLIDCTDSLERETMIAMPPAKENEQD